MMHPTYEQRVRLSDELQSGREALARAAVDRQYESDPGLERPARCADAPTLARAPRGPGLRNLGWLRKVLRSARADDWVLERHLDFLASAIARRFAPDAAKWIVEARQPEARR